MGLEVAGVDMLEARTGPKIMEVNSSPGLRGARGRDRRRHRDALRRSTRWSSGARASRATAAQPPRCEVPGARRAAGRALGRPSRGRAPASTIRAPVPPRTLPAEPVSLVLYEDPLSPWCLVAERRIRAALEDVAGAFAPLRLEPFPLRAEPRALTAAERRALVRAARGAPRGAGGGAARRRTSGSRATRRSRRSPRSPRSTRPGCRGPAREDGAPRRDARGRRSSAAST